MNTVSEKGMVKAAVAAAKSAMTRFNEGRLKAGNFDAVTYFDTNFQLCTPELRAEMVAKLKASAFYKNRLG